MWVCGNGCCVAAVVIDSGFSLVVLSILYGFIRDAMAVLFYVCIVRSGAVGALV